MKNCPFCGEGVDPLRAAAVSIVNGKITHFCSIECRETYLQRSSGDNVDDAIDAPNTEKDTPPGVSEPIHPGDVDGSDFRVDSKSDAPTVNRSLNAASPHMTAASLFSFRNWDLLGSWMVECGVLLLLFAFLIIFRNHYNSVRIGFIVASAGIFFSLGLAIYREVKNGVASVVSSVCVPLASVALVVSAFFSGASFGAVATALLLSGIRALGRCLEYWARSESGVLQVISGAASVWIPREWRDNSSLAVRIRKISMVLVWARIPVSLLMGVVLKLVWGVDFSEALLAAAVLLVSLESRLLRMVTGDAHLKVAIIVGKSGGQIRDADAVDRLSKAKTLLMIAKDTLLAPEVSVVDFEFENQSHPEHVLSSLMAVESAEDDRYARAIVKYCAAHGAKKIEKVSAVRTPEKGVCGDTIFGFLHCGSRVYMLENGISTAQAETRARELELTGRRVLFVAMNSEIVASFAVDEQLRDGARSSIQHLCMMGYEPVMLTSADVDSAQALGGRLGIENVKFERSVMQLEDTIVELQTGGCVVTLMGGGTAFEQSVNNADCAVAMGESRVGTSLAGIDLRGLQLTAVVSVFQAAGAARRSVMFNLLTSMLLFSFGVCFAIGWHTPTMLFGIVSMVSLLSLSSTISGPYPHVRRFFHRFRRLIETLLQLVGLARKR